MKKRLLFIGSSTEGLGIAQQLKSGIELECGDWIHAVIWDEGSIFTQNKTTLESLLKASRKFDYGVLVATNDDIVRSRGKQKAGPRDNVMLEMGMFLGSLGLTRAFLVVEEKGKLATDFNGVTIPYFQRDVKESIDDAIKKITDAFNSTKFSYNLKPMPSAALALGYFDNFIQPLAKKRLKQNIDFRLTILLPKQINNIFIEKNAYLNTNPSTEISVYSDGSRPLVYELALGEHQYWDIPTTLSTLSKLMDMLIPSKEIGIDHEKQAWIEHELRSFEGTIMTLVNQCAACREKVEVVHL